MEYALIVIASFLSGLLTGRLTKGKKRRRRTAPKVPKISVSGGPKVYTVEKRKKPKIRSDFDLWQRENAQNVQE